MVQTATRRNPQRTREQILGAAMSEFAENGFDGARIDQIAARAGANKRMLYHYFGNKEELFVAVLEQAYEDIRRAEGSLRFESLDPRAGMRKLIEFSFDYCIVNPHFIRLLNSENLHSGRHLRKSAGIRRMHSRLIETISDLLERGQSAGVFRQNVDPLQLYVSIAGLGYFYVSNIHTLSAIFGEDLSRPHVRAQRRRHVVDVILDYLKP
jgi:AcrR family transcriptional regulator